MGSVVATIEAAEPFLRAITTEEVEWTAVGFGATTPKSAIEFGKGGDFFDQDQYWTRSLDDANDPDGSGVARLRETVIPTECTPEEALALRAEHDKRWKNRGKIRDAFADLVCRGALYIADDRALIGRRKVTGSSHNESITPIVRLDGTTSVRIDNPTLVLDEMNMFWHEYILPTGSSDGIHRIDFVHPDTGKPDSIRRIAYDSGTILFNLGLNLDTFRDPTVLSEVLLEFI